MSTDQLKSLLEQLAEVIMMANADDRTVFAHVGKLLSDIEELLPGGDTDEIQKELKKCKATCDKLAAGKLKDAERGLSRLTDNIALVQKLIFSTEQSSAFPPMENDGQFELSEWVDENLFREFLANQKHVIEEIEACILGIEGGKTDLLGSMKRTIHTMKGEAGVLGLTDLEKMCHGLEDYISAQTYIMNHTEELLTVKDWIASAIEQYSQMLIPEPGADVILSRLETMMSAVSEVAFNPADSSGADADADADESEDGGAHNHATGDHGPKLVNLPNDEETLELLVEFVTETEDGIARADDILINVESEGAPDESVNGLFRIFHTIKGVAGFLELDDISKLAHSTENMLNKVRSGERVLEGTILDLVFDSTAMMRGLIKEIRVCIESGSPLAIPPEHSTLMTKIEAVLAGVSLQEEELPVADADDKLGQILTRPPLSIAPQAIFQALEHQKETGKPLGQELIAAEIATPKQVSQALRSQQRAAQAGAAPKIRETVKVDLERVDNLVEMIGELVIVESMLVHAPEISNVNAPKVRNYLGQLAKITRDLQDVGMRMRMVPVRGVFQKMARMVRDLSRKSSKRIRFVQTGEGTEIDRSMVEQISDPLVHMIRNSVDHGVEEPGVRVASGKDETGTIRLSAYHEGGALVIELSDDGKGLDKEAIVSKAKKNGLIKDENLLSESDIYNLIFQPGFSTAKKVTDISGRGVGMDVVKKKIDGLRGRVTIQSSPGEGTTFKMILPLTLAIIDGMLVACGQEQYIIPTLSIIESIQVTPGMFVTFAESGELINVRGEIMPFLRLARLFDIAGGITDPTEGIVVVVEGVGQRIGIFVDSVVTQQQVVIKTLGENLKDSKYVSGAAILSDGRVGLIVNVDQIGERFDSYGKQSGIGQTSQQLPVETSAELPA
ncbi:MAG: Hpt domain-containing protein [Deltaproteobacteria bacterium]|nr:Hpt domain-containing protein [Deltaproteobacteria bacterium]